jgi:hypothetical protein
MGVFAEVGGDTSEGVVSLGADESNRLRRFLLPPPGDAAGEWLSALRRTGRALRDTITRGPAA